MSLTALVGYLAGAVGTVLMLPQVVQSWRTRQVDDLSLTMVCLYVVNCGLWLAFGLLAGVRPVWVTNAAALAISLAQLGLKVRFARPARRRPGSPP